MKVGDRVRVRSDLGREPVFGMGDVRPNSVGTIIAKLPNLIHGHVMVVRFPENIMWHCLPGEIEPVHDEASGNDYKITS